MKNNKLVTLVLSALIALSPIMTSAFELNLKDNSDVKLNAVVNNLNATASSNANVNSSANVSSDNEKNEKDDSKQNKQEEKSEAKAEAKNDNQFFNWLKKFIKIDNRSTLPFKILGVHIVTATSTGSVMWHTDASSTGYVRMNTDQNLVASSTKVMESGSLDSEHKVALGGLSPDTTYYYIVGGVDASGKVVETKVSHFKTKKINPADVALPNILFSGTFKVGASSANVIWVTSKPTTGSVWISTTSGVTATGTPKVTSGNLNHFHNLTLSNLATSTTYFYVVGSTDASGNTVFGGQGSFQTTSQ